MRQRTHLSQKHMPTFPRSRKWYHLFTARFLGGITLAGIILYIVDSISQNALGQFGISIIQSLLIQLHIITIVIWLCCIIVLFFLLIIGLLIWAIRKQSLFKHLEQDNKCLEHEKEHLQQRLKQSENIVEVDEYILNQLPGMISSREEGEENEK